MSDLTLAAFGFSAMLVAIFLRVPVAAAMGVTGFLGTWYILGSPNALLSQLKTLSFDTFSSYSLSVVPLFLLMGQFATKSGMSAALFRAASAWFGHWRGGLAMASVGASAGFGAICGSSLATASTMGQVALPELRRQGYSGRLSTGALAAGGTLGILIPPSVILVIYAILTEQNIVTMFVAAIVPGLLATIGYLIAVAIYARFRPGEAPAQTPQPFGVRCRALLGIWPVVLIFGTVMGGIVGDWDWSREGVQALFTPTEGAAVGAMATALYAVVFAGVRWGGVKSAFLETASATAMIFLILLGAQVFNTFLAYTQAPQALAAWAQAGHIAPMTLLLLLLFSYLVLGCVMDSLSMILLTIPVFFPIIEGLDFGMPASHLAIWFGILALMVVEIGLITPPVGLNLFIVNRMAGDVPLQETYRGVLPFVATDIVRVGLLIAFPGLTLWLVGSLG